MKVAWQDLDLNSGLIDSKIYKLPILFILGVYHRETENSLVSQRHQGIWITLDELGLQSWSQFMKTLNH